MKSFWKIITDALKNLELIDRVTDKLKHVSYRLQSKVTCIVSIYTIFTLKITPVFIII